jgi:hypothetical protein
VKGGPAGTFRHLVPSRSINCQRARSFHSNGNKTVYGKRAVIVGEESLVVNSESSVLIASGSTPVSEAFLTEFKSTGFVRQIQKFGTRIHWIHAKSIHFESRIHWFRISNPLASGLDHNASGQKPLDSKVEMNGFSAESTGFENRIDSFET